ncbi:ThuA domain-containing protein [Pelagicoccus sp. SDUM812003]|uniref:ThuA domain-containing protein n=1 Tax=Pelagicoccus sp. SDUM812003 TaxID=3041267 RepID=UPI00281002CC|nr:ThuA domain-containing protein [Pelagicoccus sp. SDUM812003]MDQ8201895.1 ThuA domain-containing protein [Pelagicoccus sp. SDUM812003]
MTRPLSLLLLTGQSGEWHNWPVSSRYLRSLLEQEDRFRVTYLESPAAGESMRGFAPDWGAYDVVVLDYEGEAWPIETRKAFETYMEEGGGLVVFHSTNNAFPDWPAFNEMIAVGGWGGRDEKDGSMIRWRNGKMELDSRPGAATHPPPYAFEIESRAEEHPVLRGLPQRWLHATDELYSQLRGPARNVTVLATSRADPDEVEGGTGENEPVLMAIEYGKGRVFHTTLGHVHFDRTEAPESLRCVGFVETFLRGAEWAATGAVTRPAPEAFPCSDSISLR